MPLFDDPVPTGLLWPKRAQAPIRRARALVARFEKSFPDIAYDIDLGVELANAQAFRYRAINHVRLYGGLIRHRRIGFAGLAVVLAHETGHHLGGPPHLSFYKWLSSEERATEWAMTIGLKVVFGEQAASVGDRGWRELRSIGVA